MLCLAALDGDRLASGSEDGTVKIWEVYNQRRCMRTSAGAPSTRLRGIRGARATFEHANIAVQMVAN